jgi:hypothetical protein
MAKESSAINELVALMSARPMVRESSDELLFQAPRGAPPPRPRPRPAMRVKPAPVVRPMPVLASGTSKSARSSRSMLAIPASVVGVIALLGAGYLWLREDHPHTTRVAAPAATALAARAPAPVAPVVTPPPPAPPAKPTTTTVRLESTPAGATVTAGGAFVGTTPIDAALDPTRSVELVFSLDGHPQTVRTIDPSKTPRLAVELGPDPVASVAPAPAPAKHHSHHHHASSAKKHHSAAMHARS